MGKFSKVLVLFLALTLTMIFMSVALAEVNGDVAVHLDQIQIDLTQIVLALIGVLATLITTRLMPWIKARTTMQQRELLQGWVRTLVFAAEQIYGSGLGNKKMRFVMDTLRQKGFDADLPTIEAAVRDMNLWVPVSALSMTEEVPNN